MSARYQIEWRAYGPNHTRSEYYGEAEWQTACSEAGVSADARFDSVGEVEEAIDLIAKHLPSSLMVSCRVVSADSSMWAWTETGEWLCDWEQGGSDP